MPMVYFDNIREKKINDNADDRNLWRCAECVSAHDRTVIYDTAKNSLTIYTDSNFIHKAQTG